MREVARRPGAVADMMTVEAELAGPMAAAQIARYRLERARDYHYGEDAVWLDLCLTPRPETWARDLDSDTPHHAKRVGPLLIIPARRRYAFRCDEGASISVSCQLQPNLFEKWLERPLDCTDFDLGRPQEPLGALMQRLACEIRSPGMASETYCELLFGQIAIELSRARRAQDPRQPRGGLAPWRLRLIDDRLNEPATAPSLRDLAELCKLSVRQLTRGFQVSRGCSIGAYAAQVRVERAKLLLAGDVPQKAIAQSMGFQSTSAFICAFRRATGLPPQQYRQKLLGRPRGRTRAPK